MGKKERLSLREMHCWEIIGCQGTENCPARQHPEIPCWELARDLEDYRSVFKICRDCIVFMVKNETIVLSDEEKHSIINQTECWVQSGLQKDN
jgi:hypothetical protein